MDFLDYWGTRIDANESIFNTNPGLANFAFSEAQALFEKMTEDAAAFRAYHDKLLTALDVIQSGFEFRNAAPKMNGTFERHPHLIDRKRMMEIARDALEK